MVTMDWRGFVNRAVEEHLTAIRSPLADEEARRRVQAGGQLHHLAAWVQRQCRELEKGSRPGFDGPSKSDPVWVARAKIQLRLASAKSAKRGTISKFLRSVGNQAGAWEELSRDLLAGSAPPPAPPEDKPQPPPAHLTPATPVSIKVTHAPLPAPTPAAAAARTTAPAPAAVRPAVAEPAKAKAPPPRAPEPAEKDRDKKKGKKSR